MDLATALHTLRTAAGDGAVAPHVAARLAYYTQGDPVLLTALGSALSAAQLQGTSLLPDPLPLLPGLQSSSAQGLLAAERRLLLFAALDSDLSLSELIEAAGVEPEVLLFGALTTLLRGEGSRARFVNETLRDQILLESNPHESGTVHAALARAHRRQGNIPAAAVHLLAEDPRRLPELSTALVARTELLFRTGRLPEAYRLARTVGSGGGELASRAWSVAGKSALWAGALGDARKAFEQIAPAEAGGETAQELVQALDIIEHGPHGTYYTAEETHLVFRALAAATPKANEQRLMRNLGAVFTTVYSDPGRADALLARALLGAPSIHDPSWSPLAAACLAVAQLTVNVFAGDYETAGTLLAATASRFPLALVGGGVVAEYARVCIGHGPGIDEKLVRAYLSITPESRTLLSDELAAIMFSEETTVLARAASGFRVDMVAPKVASKMMPVPVEPLSPRQRDVLALILRGRSNRDIAEALQISPRTVEVHVTQVMRKYELRSRTALIALHAAG